MGAVGCLGDGGTGLALASSPRAPCGRWPSLGIPVLPVRTGPVMRCTVKKLIAIAIISASLAPRPALAGNEAAQCGTLTFPPGDLPTADEAKALKGCDFDSLYYGLD